MTIEVQHILYAESPKDAAAIMDNAISGGADEVKAVWDSTAKVYRIEYRTEDWDNENDAM